MERKCPDCEYIAKNEFGLQLHYKAEHSIKKPEPVTVTVEPETVTITLRNHITINGSGWGGTVTVPKEFAKTLRNLDDNAEASNMRDHQIINIETQHRLREIRG